MTRRELKRMAGVIHTRLPELELETLSDPRKARGKRWRLPVVLRTAIVGMMAGCKSLADVEALTTQMSRAMRCKLGVPRRLADTTLRDVLCALDPKEVRRSLHAAVRAAERRKALKPVGLPFGVVAMDGKATEIRRADEVFSQHRKGLRGGLIRTLTSALISTPARPCIDALPIAAASNEMGTFVSALDALLQAYSGTKLFKMVTYDAGACSLHNATVVRERGLHYLFALNAAQPSLFAEAKRLLAHQNPTEALARTEDVVGNKTVVRTLHLTDQMAEFLDWSHLKTVLRVSSTTFDQNNQRVAHLDRYFLCDLTPHVLSHAQWLRIVRGHWGVENNNHHTLDTVFAEDDRPWISQHPAGMLVALVLRRIAYTLMTLFRSVTQRTQERRAIPWRSLLRWVELTILLTDNDILHALRARTVPTTR